MLPANCINLTFVATLRSKGVLLLGFFFCTFMGNAALASPLPYHDLDFEVSPQNAVASVADSVPAHRQYITEYNLPPEVMKRRVRTMAILQGAGYSAAMIGLYATWYKDYPQSGFHFFNDINEWKGLDKLGHVFSAYGESKASMELWRWTGIDRKKRIWLGGITGFAYQTVIEILDGFSAEWGFSIGDFAANIIGSGMLISQELAWNEQRIQIKWSFHKKTYNDIYLNERSDLLFGKTAIERFIKDYNGQNFWLSANIRSFFPESGLPKWFAVSVGAGGNGMFGGYENIAKDKAGNITFDRRDIPRYRQWFLAPDVDLSKIPTNKKGVRIALDILNLLKFPTPALEYSRNKLQLRFLVF